MKFLTLGAAVVALAINSGAVSAADTSAADKFSPHFTISGGTAETLMPTSGPTGIPVGTTGYGNALLTISHTGAYKFTFLGCGDSALDNQFFLSGAHVPGKTFPRVTLTPKFFDCNTSKIGDSFIGNLNKNAVVPHAPFSFQASADTGGPSVFNGEGPFTGTYTNGVAWSNTSIFYAIPGSTATPGATSGDAVLMGLSDGGRLMDNDHQDLVVEISLPKSH